MGWAIVGPEAVLDAVRVVWASLWSDAALLYRQELALDPACSRMAVVVQEMIDQARSGVAFGRDPREPAPARPGAGAHACGRRVACRQGRGSAARRLLRWPKRYDTKRARR
jgi:hypothetical protein